MERVIIMGAAGRDFHDFLTVFRNNADKHVVGFTQTAGQNLGETGEEISRTFPAEIAGDLYTEDIPIYAESNLESVIQEKDVDTVYFSYSDVSHEHVMHLASRALAAGVDFEILGPDQMMLSTDLPVIAVDAVRTGCGKSEVTTKITNILQSQGKTPRVIREPMPYGDLSSSEVQRFASRDDLEQADVTIEEREEYEKHIDNNHIVFAGIDYQTILSSAESEGDIIVWDGGNNELPFIEPTVHFVLADPLRASDTLSYHPGETNLRMADYVLINKENSASQNNINTVVSDVNEVNESATILHADSIVEVDTPSQIRNNDVLVVEDGPTVTHGNANYGAGTISAQKYDANNRIDPRSAAVGSIQHVLAEYDQLDRILPAMGYSSDQIDDLSETIANVDCDVVVAGTPIDLQEIIDIDKPIVQAEYTVSVHDRSFQDVLQSHADVLTLNNVSQ